MVNSTSATAAADINEEECEQMGLSPTAGSVASEVGAFLDMCPRRLLGHRGAWLEGTISGETTRREITINWI